MTKLIVDYDEDKATADYTEEGYDVVINCGPVEVCLQTTATATAVLYISNADSLAIGLVGFPLSVALKTALRALVRHWDQEEEAEYLERNGEIVIARRTQPHCTGEGITGDCYACISGSSHPCQRPAPERQS